MGDSSPITTRQAGAERVNPRATPLRLEAAVLDWAGTVVDFGSFAPTQIFVEAFAEFNVAITLDEARGPMGVGKWDHIRTLCNDGAIAARFSLAHGRMPTDDDVTAIYNCFMPLQIEKVGAHSALIPGALETIAALREAGLKIGTCSGYPRVVMDRVVALAAEAGYRPDCVIACDEVPRARPWPAQALRNVVDLGIGDVAACVKVDDTVPGIEEGRRAGMWTVALLMWATRWVCRTSNTWRLPPMSAPATAWPSRRASPRAARITRSTRLPICRKSWPTSTAAWRPVNDRNAFEFRCPNRCFITP